MSHYTPTAPAVSVLMALQDAEKTVRRGVESLQNQTLANFELIAVDAGSADGTVDQLETIAERDMRVAVVRAGRCSRPEALDLALGRARGEYVLVMDADGWADRTMLEDLVLAAREGSLELVAGGFTVALGVGDGRAVETVAASEGEVFATQNDFRAAAWGLFASGQLLPTCAKLFSRSLLERSRASFAAEGRRGHDFVLAALRDVERVGVLGGICYHVSRRLAPVGGAAGFQRSYRQLEDEHTALLELYRCWGLEGDAASMEMLQSRYVERLAACVEAVCGRGSRVPAPEQRRIVSEMIETDRAQVAASVAHPRNNAVRALLAPIRAHNASLVCVQTRLLSMLRPGIAGANPDLFV